MTCEKCNTELPSNAVACWRCGTALSDITFVRPIENVGYLTPKREKGISASGIVLLTLLTVTVLVAIVVFAAALVNREKVERSSSLPPILTENEIRPTPVRSEIPTATPKPSATPKPIPTPLIINIGMRIPNEQPWIELDVAEPSRLTGRLRGTGGIHGEFTFAVLTDEQFVTFRNANGAAVPTLAAYNEMAEIPVNVQMEPGKHYLYFKSVGLVGRNITGKLTLQK